LSLFSNLHRFLFLIFITYCSNATAVTIRALYTSACQRSLGVILDIDDKNIIFLNLQNGVQNLSRYELIYIADYPLDKLPLAQDFPINEVPLVQVDSLIKKQQQVLLRGWPVGFNAEKIAFLTEANREVVIDSHNIFQLHLLQTKNTFLKGDGSFKSYHFVHPYPFRDCSNTVGGQMIYPQQILSDPIQIKKSLDSLKEGFDRIRRYNREQNFYGVPEIYKNRTELGLWLSTGSRYGASSDRSNNFLPALVNQYSSDIFDYQHYFVTGSAPLLMGTHEEPQTQGTYAFKASYFHFSSMIDPNLVLVGTNYKWRKNDFDPGKSDVRINDKTIVEAGFDYGGFDIKIFPVTSVNIGLWNGVNVMAWQPSFTRFGVGYRAHNWSIDFNGGSKSESTTDSIFSALSISFMRMNLSVDDLYHVNWTYSLIKRKIGSSGGSSTLQSDSFTNAIYAQYALSKRLRLGGFASYEMIDFSNNENSHNDNFVKFGIDGFLSF
jgi:hypothetical protein